MQKVNQGFVLFAVLIFMQIYALIGIAALLSVRLADHTTQAIEFRYIVQGQAETILQQVEAGLAHTEFGCRIDSLSNNQLLHFPTEWWEENGCRSRIYSSMYYVIDKREIDHCAAMQNAQGQLVAAQYYRVTLHVPYGKLNHLILQSSVAFPSVEAVQCNDQPHHLRQGRQGEWVA